MPSLVLANYEEDREALAWYEANGPNHALGVAHDLSCEGLRAALRTGWIALAGRSVSPTPGLGSGATRLAESLLRRAA